MLKDAGGNFIPQYYNPDTDSFEKMQGAAGASHSFLGSGSVFDSAGVSRPVQKAFVNASALGNSLLVAGVAGFKIRVISIVIITTSAVTLKFQSGTVDASCGFPLSNNGGAVLPLNEHGWVDTDLGADLNVNLSVGSTTGVQINYILTT